MVNSWVTGTKPILPLRWRQDSAQRAGRAPSPKASKPAWHNVRPAIRLPYNIAALYAGLGKKEEAFKWLNTAYQERDWQMESLKTDFLLDPLRSDQRFAEMVRRVGLPQ